MKIGDLVVVELMNSKLKYVFPKRTGKLDAIPAYPIEALSPEGFVKPSLKEPISSIQNGEIVMFLGKWDESHSNCGLSKVLYGDKLYAVLSDCLRSLQTGENNAKCS